MEPGVGTGRNGGSKMFELTASVIGLAAILLLCKLIAFVLHLVFIPLRILGGLLLVLVALPIVLITMPFLLVGGALAGVACLAFFSFLF